MAAVRVGEHVFDVVDYDPNFDTLYLGKSGLRETASGRDADSPEGHAMRFTEDGELAWIEMYDARGLLRRLGRVPVTDEDGAFIGDAQVTDIVRARRAVYCA